jgi:hypothetical protein
LRVSHADPADSDDGGHALVETDEAAIGTAGLAAVIGAPRIVLGAGARAESRDAKKSRGYEQESLHGSYFRLNCPLKTPRTWAF